MGRKPVEKKRLSDPSIRAEWIAKLMPIYMKSGLKKFTMNEISTELGVSKATVYKHFSSQTEILEEVVRTKITEIAAFEEFVEDQNIPYMTRYHNSIKSASLHLAGISNQFLLDLRELYPDMWERVMSLQYFAAERAKAFYQEGIDKGFLNDFDPNWLAITDKIFIIGLSNPQFLIDNDLTLQKAVDNYFKLKRQGIFKKGNQNE
jgi:AcrR family transcriptional regulator